MNTIIKKRSYGALAIIFGLSGIWIMAENIHWYYHLNGTVSKELFYKAKIINKEKNSKLDGLQMVQAKVLGDNPGNYRWAYRYSTINGLFPTWPFVKTIIRKENTRCEYLNSIVEIPSPSEEHKKAFESSIKERMTIQELFSLYDGSLTGLVWLGGIILYLYIELYLLRKGFGLKKSKW